jgi:hypothetical protein
MTGTLYGTAASTGRSASSSGQPSERWPRSRSGFLCKPPTVEQMNAVRAAAEKKAQKAKPAVAS